MVPEKLACRLQPPLALKPLGRKNITTIANLFLLGKEGARQRDIARARHARQTPLVVDLNTCVLQMFEFCCISSFPFPPPRFPGTRWEWVVQVDIHHAAGCVSEKRNHESIGDPISPSLAVCRSTQCNPIPPAPSRPSQGDAAQQHTRSPPPSSDAFSSPAG